MKEFAKASENEKPISSDKKIVSQEFEVLFFEEIKSFKLHPFILIIKQILNSNYSNLYFYLNSVPFFVLPFSFLNFSSFYN